MVFKKIGRALRILKGLKARKRIRKKRLAEKKLERKRGKEWRDVYLQRIKNFLETKNLVLSKDRENFLGIIGAKRIEAIYFELQGRLNLNASEFGLALDACIRFFREKKPGAQINPEALHGYVEVFVRGGVIK